MSNTVAYVTAGKPVISGAVFRAPLSDTLVIPTSATTELPSDFKAMGYVSDDGVTNSNSPSVEDIQAWGTEIVLSTQKEKPDTWKLTLIEALNVEVLKAVYGDANVTGALATGVVVSATADEPEEACWVIDMRMRGNVWKRVVIPRGKVTEIGDITYKDDEVVGYELTITAMPGTGGTHKEYIINGTE